MSCRRPSNASSRVSGPWGPVSARTRSLSSSAWKAARSTAAGRLAAVVAPTVGPPGSADSSVMTSSFERSVRAFVFLCRRVCRFGEPFDRAQAPVPLGSEVSHGPSGLVETAGFYPVENLPTLLAPADQPGLFEHDQMLGDRLAGEGHVASQPAGADVTVADQEVEHPATRRVADGRPQLVIGLRRHPDWRFASNVARRSRYSAQTPRCSSA